MPQFSRSNNDQPFRSVPPTAVREELKRVLSSREFRRSPTASRLLGYLVTRALAGNPTSEEEIARRVFQKAREFDPRTDPAVRVEVRRLRQRLARYFEMEGRDDPVRILLPSKGYCPELVSAAAPIAGSTAAERPVRSIGLATFSGIGARARELAHALCTEILQDLAAAPDLRVVALGPESESRGADDEVDAILRGAVRVTTGETRISIYLMRRSDRAIVFSDSFSTSRGKPEIALETIAGNIVEALRIKLLAVNPASTALARPPWNVDTCLALLAAQQHYALHSRSALVRCEEQLSHLIQLDPASAAARAMLAEVYAAEALLGIAPPAVVMPHARSNALHALAVDSHASRAYEVLGAVAALYDWDADKAERLFQAGARVRTEGSRWYAICRLLPEGRFEEAIDHARQAVELEPTSPVALYLLAWLHYLCGDPRDVIHLCRRAVDLRLESYLTQWCEGLAFLEIGRHDDAIDSLERANAANSDIHFVIAALAHAHGVKGNSSRARALLGDLKARRQHVYVSPFDIAVAHLGLAEIDAAMIHLRAAHEERSPRLIVIGADSRFLPLRANAAFETLLRDHRIALRNSFAGELSHRQGR